MLPDEIAGTHNASMRVYLWNPNKCISRACQQRTWLSGLNLRNFIFVHHEVKSIITTLHPCVKEVSTGLFSCARFTWDKLPLSFLQIYPRLEAQFPSFQLDAHNSTQSSLSTKLSGWLGAHLS